MRKFKIYTFREEYVIGSGDFSQSFIEKKEYILVDSDILYPGDFEDLISWATFFMSQEEALQIAERYKIDYEVEYCGENKEKLPSPRFPYKEGMELYSKEVVQAIRHKVDEIVAAREVSQTKIYVEDNANNQAAEEVLYQAIFEPNEGQKEAKRQDYKLYTFYPAGSLPNCTIQNNHILIRFTNSFSKVIGYVIAKKDDKKIVVSVPAQYKGAVIGKNGQNIKATAEKYKIDIIIK